jgi:Holliday junction DNA helicase RuvA
LLREETVIVNVGGVGYEVHVTKTFLETAHQGQTVDLYTHTHVRENELALYGFITLAEMDLFRTLIGVSGVGPRTAMGVLSVFSPEVLRGAIVQGDVLALTRIPGIGRKTAQRLVLDLKEKLGASAEASLLVGLGAGDADALNALTALGYSVTEAQSALANVPAEVHELDQRIVAALRYLGGG